MVKELPQRPKNGGSEDECSPRGAGGIIAPLKPDGANPQKVQGSERMQLEELVTGIKSVEGF